MTQFLKKAGKHSDHHSNSYTQQNEEQVLRGKGNLKAFDDSGEYVHQRYTFRFE